MANKVLTSAQKTECNQVRGYRMQLRLTQKQFAEATGLSEPTIKNIESHRTSVTYKTKCAINTYLKSQGISSDWFDADDKGNVDLYYAIRGLMGGKSMYGQEIADCIEAIVSTKSFKDTHKRDQYIEFVSATMKEYMDICRAEANAIKKKSDTKLVHELDSFSRAVKTYRKRIFDENSGEQKKEHVN